MLRGRRSRLKRTERESNRQARWFSCVWRTFSSSATPDVLFLRMNSRRNSVSAVSRLPAPPILWRCFLLQQTFACILSIDFVPPHGRQQGQITRDAADLVRSQVLSESPYLPLIRLMGERFTGKVWNYAISKIWTWFIKVSLQCGTRDFKRISLLHSCYDEH